MLDAGKNEEGMWMGGTRVVLAGVKCDIEMEARANTALQMLENKSETLGEEMSLSSFQATPVKKFIE